MNEKSPPFDQSVISIAHAWEYLKKEKSIRGQLNNQTTKQLNNFKDILVKLGCEPLGESLHRYSKRKVTLYIIRNHEFFGDKRKSQIATDYFFPEPSTIGER